MSEMKGGDLIEVAIFENWKMRSHVNTRNDCVLDFSALRAKLFENKMKKKE